MRLLLTVIRLKALPLTQVLSPGFPQEMCRIDVDLAPVAQEPAVRRLAGSSMIFPRTWQLFSQG